MRSRKEEGRKKGTEIGNVGEIEKARQQAQSLEGIGKGEQEAPGNIGAGERKGKREGEMETGERKGKREGEMETGERQGESPGKIGKGRRMKDEAGIGFMLFLMAACGILEGVGAGILTGQEEDRVLALAFLGILYYVALLMGMELCRRQRDWFYEKAGNYRQMALWHGLSCAAAVGMLFLPEFARLLLLASMGMALVSNSLFGMMFGMFHGMVYALCGQENIYTFLCSILLVMGGCLAAYFLENRENLPWKAAFLFLYVFVDVLVFSYLAYGTLEWDVLAFGAGNGLASAMAGVALFPVFSKRLQDAPREKVEKILQENFGLVQDVRNFSKADYEHAKRVSELAGACAKLVGADPDVASAGGFYYRLGRMVGEPFVENGVALAKSSHLPRPVVRILSEYYGEKNLPSTVESAIVHIVDSLAAKFDTVEEEAFPGGWNQDILVYQTLNENSAAGLYDASGVSMNMFLKIRDYLIKEAELF